MDWMKMGLDVDGLVFLILDGEGGEEGRKGQIWISGLGTWCESGKEVGRVVDMGLILMMLIIMRMLWFQEGNPVTYDG